MTKQIWAKKPVSKQEYKNWHSKMESYTPLKDEGDRVWVGFLAANVVPDNCLEVTGYEELNMINMWRERHNIRPKPIDDKFKNEKVVKPEVIAMLDKWKKEFFKGTIKNYDSKK